MTFFPIGVSCAAEIGVEVSSNEMYVGIPIVLQVQIRNANKHQPPTIDDVEGLEIQQMGGPAKNSRVTIINGRRTESSSLVYSYEITPHRPGEFTIPPIKVSADGVASATKAIRLVATKSETGDLMFAEVVGKKVHVYVGQSLPLTLRIWMRPYKNREFGITLNAENMWSLVSKRTNWGPFTDAINQMRMPDGRRTLRPGRDGEQQDYYLYEIDATTYPDRPGKIDGDAIRIIVDYPLALGKSRSPFEMMGGMFGDDLFRGFGSRLEITKVRPISAEASVDSTLVKPIPSEGRPANYRGAVGKYSILTQASHLRVRVGDPVTLHIAIDGDGPMDVISAPPLDQQSSLNRDFKVPDDSLAGLIDGSRKVFSTTIRPIHDGVTEVPPISMSYFDPDEEQFVSVQSDSIAIEVDEAEQLSLDSIVGAAAGNLPSGQSGSDHGGQNESGNSGQDSKANRIGVFSSDHVLITTPLATLVPWSLIFWLIAPPLITMLLVVYFFRHVTGGMVSAQRQFRRRLANATTAEQVGESLVCFLTRKLRLTEGPQIQDRAVGSLRANRHQELAIQTERLFAQCDQSVCPSHDHLESLKTQALNVVHGLAGSGDKTSLRSRKQLSSSSALWAIGISLCLANSHSAAEISLSHEQRRQILTEAVSLYDSVPANTKAGNSNQAMSDAATKFQLLVDSGIRNGQLYCNLASAQARSGSESKAIANYRRALKLEPTQSVYFERLKSLKQRLSAPAGNASSISVRRINDIVLGYIIPTTMRMIAIVSWGAFWLLVIPVLLRHSDVPLGRIDAQKSPQNPHRFRWRTAAAIALVISVVSASSFYLRVSEFAVDACGVLVRENISVRSGDGQEFPQRKSLTDAKGTMVRVLDHRQDWYRVRLSGGSTGWIPADAIEVI